jgi:virginiamycin B lyase
VEIKKFNISGAGPRIMAVSKGGTPWYSGNYDKHIDQMNPETGK